MSDIKQKTVDRAIERISKGTGVSRDTATKMVRESAERLNRQKRGEK
jgi:hypothetical protein